MYSENNSEEIDIETVDTDPKIQTYRPEIECKSMEQYKNSKLSKDPDTWEDNINKYVCNCINFHTRL